MICDRVNEKSQGVPPGASILSNFWGAVEENTLTLEVLVLFLRLMAPTYTIFTCVPARYIQSFEAFSEYERHPLGVSKLLCEFFMSFS